MTTALVALGSALITLGLVLVVLLVVRRGRPAPAESQGMSELTLAVRELNSRVDSLASELTQALERSQEGDRRNKHFGELAGSIDLDEVLTRVLDTMSGLESKVRRRRSPIDSAARRPHAA